MDLTKAVGILEANKELWNEPVLKRIKKISKLRTSDSASRLDKSG
jgi:hypothetical protein